MSVVVITPPGPLIELALTKAHLRVRHADDDALINSYIAAVSAHIDGPDGWLNRAVGQQVLELRTHCFGSYSLILPYPPVISITSVKYTDRAGEEQVVDPAIYREIDGGLARKTLAAWPTDLASEPDAARIRYVAGFTSTPPSIVAAALLMVGDLYANRETSVIGTIAAAIPMSASAENLLAPFRVMSV